MRDQFLAAVGLLAFGPVSLVQAHVPASSVPQTPSPVELSTLSPNLFLPFDPSKPLRVSGGIIAGQIYKRVAFPVFPPKTNCSRGSRVVQMHAVIGKDGHVKSVEAISGADAMRQPTVDAVRQWKYKPFQFHGKPVEVETTITLISDLDGSGC